MIDALGWPVHGIAANIDPMKQVRRIIGFAISAAGLVVLAGGLL